MSCSDHVEKIVPTEARVDVRYIIGFRPLSTGADAEWKLLQLQRLWRRTSSNACASSSIVLGN
jgi:hypothetical protein